MEKRLILSQIQTPDGTILRSMHQHDYVTYIDKNGETYMLDGGNEYQRYSINKEPFKDLSIWSDAPFEIIREYSQLLGLLLPKSQAHLPCGSCVDWARCLTHIWHKHNKYRLVDSHPN